jgi:hypothetical protein
MGSSHADQASRHAANSLTARTNPIENIERDAGTVIANGLQ